MNIDYINQLKTKRGVTLKELLGYDNLYLRKEGIYQKGSDCLVYSNSAYDSLIKFLANKATPLNLKIDKVNSKSIKLQTPYKGLNLYVLSVSNLDKGYLQLEYIALEPLTYIDFLKAYYPKQSINTLNLTTDTQAKFKELQNKNYLALDKYLSSYEKIILKSGILDTL